MLYDYSKLRGKIVEEYKTMRDFSAKMEWSERTLSLKMNNKIFGDNPKYQKRVNYLELKKTR